MTRRGVWLGMGAAALLALGEAAWAADVQPDTGEPSTPGAMEAEAAEGSDRAKAAPSSQELADRLDELEVKGQDAVVVGDIPGSFRIPGSDVSLRLYGFAELSWVHDFAAPSSDVDYSTFAPYLPVEDTAEAGRKHRDYLTGRTSRLGLEAGTPTKFGLLSVKVEGDFNNEPRTGGAELYGSFRNVFTQQATNSYGFRIRHAYGQFAGFLAGMTWSTFMDVDNFPETVDYNGPIGATFIRQPVLRYSYAHPTAGTFTAALENSSTYVLDGRGDSDELGLAMSSSFSSVPDLVVRWDKGFQRAAVSVRAMTQQLKVNDGEGTFATKRGWGAAVSGSLKVRDNADLVTAQVTGGEGIGRYLNYVEGAVYDGEQIHAEKAVGLVLGYGFHPADWVRVNAVFGGTLNFDGEYNDAVRLAGLDSGRFGVNRFVWQAHLGPIFTPIPGVDLGIEGIWGQRMTLAGERGEMVRLNFSAKYYIN